MKKKLMYTINAKFKDYYVAETCVRALYMVCNEALVIQEQCCLLNYILKQCHCNYNKKIINYRVKG